MDYTVHRNRIAWTVGRTLTWQAFGAWLLEVGVMSGKGALALDYFAVLRARRMRASDGSPPDPAGGR